MALEIFKLVGSIFVDNEGANNSIAKTDEKAQGLGKTMLDGIGTAAKWSAGLVAGATAVVGGLTKLATSSAETADNIDKMSQKIGITREAYQELEFILSQSGASVDNLQSGMKTLVNQMEQASNGSKSASGYFEQLGISVTNADGSLKDSEAMMWDVLEALQGMENQTEKAALATDLFGRSGTELLPLLNSEAGSIEAMKKQAHDLGIVLSDDVIDNGVELKDTMDQLKRGFEAIVTNVGGALMPILTELSQFLIANLPTIQGIMEQLTPILSAVFATLLPPLTELMQQLLPVILDLIMMLLPMLSDLINQLMPIIIDLLNMILPILVELMKELLPPIVELLSALMPLLNVILSLLSPILNLISALIKPIADLVSMCITPLVEIVVDLIDMAFKPIIPLIEVIGNLISNGLSRSFRVITPLVNNVLNVFKQLISFVKNTFVNSWKSALESVKSVTSYIFDSLVNIIKIPINTIIDGMNTFIDGLNNIKIPDWVPGMGGKGISIARIPKLADGADEIKTGQLFIANEKGPEMVGSYDGNSAVVNNGDIVKAIIAGVATGMREAMSSMPSENGIERAFEKALSKSSLVAHISQDEVFSAARRGNEAYKEQTSRYAFGY